MSANADTAAPTGRDKPAQGKERSDAALGHASQNTSSPEGAKEKGGLPKGWEWSPLGKLSNVVRGGSPRPAGDPRYFGGDIPWITVGPITADKTPYLRAVPQTVTAAGKERSRFVEPGTLLLTNSGATLGVPKITLIGGCINDGVAALLDVPESLKLYLLYFLQTQTERLRGVNQGAAQPNLNTTIIKDISVPLAPNDEQRRIVAEIEKQFTRLEAGVAALRRVQANLKRYRAAVLKAACEGRLVPTEAELSRPHPSTKNSQPAYETGAELLARILTERRQNWQGRGKYKEPAATNTAKLSPLPEGWTWASVEQLAALVQYGSSAKTNEDSSGVPVLRMGNIQEGKFDFEKLKYLPKAHDEFPDLLLVKGDLLFNRTNSAELVGKTAVFRGTPEPCSFASYLIRVRLCGGCLPDLVSYFINSVFGRAWIAGCVSQQVGQANVNGTKLQALAIPLPPLAEQTRIVAEVERRLSVVEELETVVTANLHRATRLRQSILQKAFTGEL